MKPKKTDWLAIADATLSLTPNVFGIGVDLQKILGAIRGGGPEIKIKAEQAASALQEASKIVVELQEAIESEAQRVDILKAEYEKYQGLAAIEEKQAKALMIELDQKLNEGRGRERLIALGINLLAGIIVFVLGVALSPYVKTILGLE